MRDEQLKGDRRFRKRNPAQRAIHAPAQRSQRRYLDASCSSREDIVEPDTPLPAIGCYSQSRRSAEAGCLRLYAQPPLHRRDLLFELVERLRRALEFEQRFQLRADSFQVEFSMLANQHPLDIAPVQVATGENLVDDQILSRASGERGAFAQLPTSGARDGSLLERQRTQRD